MDITGKDLTPEARRAMDVLERWSKEMYRWWHRMQPFDKTEASFFADVLKGKKNVTIKFIAGNEYVYVRGVHGNSIALTAAILAHDIDVSWLPEIRTAVVSYLTKQQDEVKSAEKEAKRKEDEARERVNKTLPSMIDDFGADIMQHGEPPPSLKENAAPPFSVQENPNTGLYRPGESAGIGPSVQDGKYQNASGGAVFGPGGGQDFESPWMSPKEMARKQFKEIQDRLKKIHQPKKETP